MKKLKFILLFFAIAIPMVIYFYATQGFKNTQDIEPDFKLTAQDFVAEFEKDDVSALAKYNAKILEIDGQLQKTSTQNDSIVKISITNDELNILEFQLQNGIHQNNLQLQVGEIIKIKGEFAGYLKDDILPGASFQFKRSVPILNN